MNEPQTLIDKLWSAHEIVRREDGQVAALGRSPLCEIASNRDPTQKDVCCQLFGENSFFGGIRVSREGDPIRFRVLLTISVRCVDSVVGSMLGAFSH